MPHAAKRSSLQLGAIGTLQQIIDGHVKIVCDPDQLVNTGLPLAGLIAADGVLIGIQIGGKPLLGKTFGFS